MKQIRFSFLGRADGPSSAEDNAEHCPYPLKTLRKVLIARLVLIVAGLLPIQLFAGRYEIPKPIITPDEIAAAAAEVPVMRLDFTLPEEKEPMQSHALSTRFFNTPEEMRYGGVTSTGWRNKWDLFADALLKNASQNKLNTEDLKKCLNALNHGRTSQTLDGYPIYCEPFYPQGTPKEKIKADREAGEKKVAEDCARIQAHPEQHYNENLAIIPVGAYLAKYPKGDCWIIVCKWEDIVDETQLAKIPPEKVKIVLSMGHIMVWALDAKTAEAIAYTSCD